MDYVSDDPPSGWTSSQWPTPLPDTDQLMNYRFFIEKVTRLPGWSPDRGSAMCGRQARLENAPNRRGGSTLESFCRCCCDWVRTPCHPCRHRHQAACGSLLRLVGNDRLGSQEETGNRGCIPRRAVTLVGSAHRRRASSSPRRSRRSDHHRPENPSLSRGRLRLQDRH